MNIQGASKSSSHKGYKIRTATIITKIGQEFIFKAEGILFPDSRYAIAADYFRTQESFFRG